MATSTQTSTKSNESAKDKQNGGSTSPLGRPSSFPSSLPSTGSHQPISTPELPPRTSGSSSPDLRVSRYGGASPYGSSYGSSYGRYDSDYGRYGAGSSYGSFGTSSYGGYGSYGGGYGSSYGGYGSSYGSYGSRYGGYGGGYGGYGGYGSGAGYGGYGAMNYGGPYDRFGPPKPGNWIERGFHWIGDLHLVTDAFSRFTGLLNANADAIHGSYSSIISVLEMSGYLGREIGAVISGFALFQAIRRFFYWILGKKADEKGPANRGGVEASLSKEFEKKQQRQRMSWANTLAVLALTVIGGPIILGLIIKVLKSISGSNREEEVVPFEPRPARALYDFKPEGPNDLEFQKGDIILVTGQPKDSGWWEGEVRTGRFQGMRGLFPANFVELSPSPSPPTPPATGSPSASPSPSPTVEFPPSGASSPVVPYLRDRERLSYDRSPYDRPSYYGSRDYAPYSSYGGGGDSYYGGYDRRPPYGSSYPPPY